jgi:plasmid stability protein
MAQIVIRNLDEAVKRGLHVRARRHGRSMEAEARAIIAAAVAASPTPGIGLGSRMAARFATVGFDDGETTTEHRGEEARAATFEA